MADLNEQQPAPSPQAEAALPLGNLAGPTPEPLPPGQSPTASVLPTAPDAAPPARSVSEDEPIPEADHSPSKTQADGTAEYQKKRAEEEAHQAEAAYHDLMSGNSSTSSSPAPTAPPEPEADAAPPGAPSKKADLTKSAILDIADSIVHPSSWLLGGVADMVNAVGHGTDLVSTWAYKALPKGTPIGYDSEKGKFLDAEEYDKYRETHPRDLGKESFPEPNTVSGKMLRNVVQFIASVAVGSAQVKLGASALGALAEGAGAAKIAQGLAGIASPVSKGQKLGKAMLASSLGTFEGIEGHSANLANLLEEHPNFLGPISYLASKGLSPLATHESDSEVMGRFKNMIVNEMPGVAIEISVPTAKALYGVLKSLDKSKALYNYVRIAAKAINGTELPALKVHPYEGRRVVDPEAAPILTGRAAEKAKAVLNGEIPGAADSDVRKIGYHLNLAAINSQEDLEAAFKRAVEEETKKAGSESRGVTVKREGYPDREGVVTWEQTNMEAAEVDGWSAALNRPLGGAFNAAEMRAVVNLHAQIKAGAEAALNLVLAEPSYVNLADAAKKISVFQMISAGKKGAAAEIGRALNILKQAAKDDPSGAQWDRFFQELGGEPLTLESMQKLAQLRSGNWEIMARELGKVAKKTSDIVAQAFVNGLFGPATIVVKGVSDFANAYKAIQDRAVAARISQAFGTDGGVEFGEALAMSHAMTTTIRESFFALAQSAKGAMGLGEELAQGNASLVSPKGAYPFEVPKPGAFRGAINHLNEETSPYLFKAFDTADKMTTFMGRAIQKVDEFSKMMAYRMELHAQALRIASQDLRSGKITEDGFSMRMAQVLADPPDSVRLAAVKSADYMTFTSKPAEALHKLGNAIQSFPIIGRALLPFKVVPANIFTQTFENTPLAPLISSWRADIAAGGARADIAWARMSTGTAILQMEMDLAYRGIITGKGPQKPSERENWLRDNSSYSIKFPGGSLSIDRLGVFGAHLRMAADLTEAVVNAENNVQDRDFAKVMSAMVLTIGNNVMSPPYMMGTSQLINALASPDQKGEKYVKHLVGSFMPLSGITHALARAYDPMAHTTDSMIQEIRSKTPVLSESEPLYRDRLGRTKSYRSPVGALYDFASPFWIAKDAKEPIDEEFRKLNWYPAPLENHINDGNKSIPLTAAQRDRYADLAGNAFKDPHHLDAQGKPMGMRDYLNAVVSGNHPDSQKYQKAKERDAEDQTQHAQEFIRAEMNRYRENAQGKMVAESSALQHDIDTKHAGTKNYKPAAARTEHFKLIGD